MICRKKKQKKHKNSSARKIVLVWKKFCQKLTKVLNHLARSRSPLPPPIVCHDLSTEPLMLRAHDRQFWIPCRSSWGLRAQFPRTLYSMNAPNWCVTNPCRSKHTSSMPIDYRARSAEMPTVRTAKTHPYGWFSFASPMYSCLKRTAIRILNILLLFFFLFVRY